jgi:hypothetical protein
MVSSLLVPQIKFRVHFSTPVMRATCLVNLALLDLITLIIIGEEYKIWRPSLRKRLHPHAILFFVCTNIPLNTCFKPTQNNYWTLDKMLEIQILNFALKFMKSDPTRSESQSLVIS